MASALPAAELAASWHSATQWRRVAALIVLALLLSLVFVQLVLQLQFVSLVPLIVWGLFAAVIWRPLVGVCVVFGLAALFEPGSPDAFMGPGYYMYYGLQNTLGLSGMIVSPLEMLLIASLLAWLVRGITGTGLDFRGGQVGRFVLLFALMLAFGVVRGRVSGGDSYIGFWELRPLLYIVGCYVLATNLVRTRLHVRLLTTSGLLGMSLYAIEGAYRRVALADTGLLGSFKESWYGHDSVVFLAGVVVLILAQQVLGASPWQRVLGLSILPVAVFTMLATERRAGQIALIMALLAVFLVFAIAHRKAFFLIAAPVLIGGAIYLPLFWNANGMLAQPARAIRSINDPDPRDAASNMSRELEKLNVFATVRAYPLLGVGFGMPFLQVAYIPDISFFPFWNFEPHHNLFWIWFKTGVIGYVIFWVIIGTTLARAAHLVKTLRARELRVFALLALGGIVAFLTFTYVDLGLTSFRLTVFLGTLVGTVAVLDRIQAEDQPGLSSSGSRQGLHP